MEYLKLLLTVLLIIQPVAANLETQEALPANTEYAGYFDFDFDKTPESFYYAGGIFRVLNNEGKTLISFTLKYPKIYGLNSHFRGDEKITVITFGDDYKTETVTTSSDNSGLKITNAKTNKYDESGSQIGALVAPSDLKVQAYYFGEALMNTPEEFRDGTAKSRYDYFQTETYRNSEDDYRRALIADVIDGKPIMLEAYEHKVYLSGEDITPENYTGNRISSFYRLENYITTTGVSGISGVFIFRITENGIEESGISHLGNGLRRPDPERNEYYLTNPMEFDGGFNFYSGGRVFKDIAFYKDENGSFREYGGIEVPIGNFLKIDGAIEAISPYLENTAKRGNANFKTIIRDVQWRENNTFTINLIDLPKPPYEEEENPNAFQNFIVFRYENGEFTEIDTFAGYSELSKSADYGRDIATYPESLPLFGTDTD
jgi:hypothetical protein